MGIAERREREKESRRRAILGAAARVFSARGFAGATMDQIALSAELSPATLYNYFKNKNDLFASLMFRVLDHLTRRIDELAARGDRSAPQKVQMLADVFLEGYRFDPWALNNLVRLQASEVQWDISAERVIELNALAREGIHALARLFEEGQATGDFAPCHPLALADMVWGIFTGLMIWEESKRHYNPKKNFFRSTLVSALEILVRGLTPGGAGSVRPAVGPDGASSEAEERGDERRGCPEAAKGAEQRAAPVQGRIQPKRRREKA